MISSAMDKLFRFIVRMFLVREDLLTILVRNHGILAKY